MSITKKYNLAKFNQLYEYMLVTLLIYIKLAKVQVLKFICSMAKKNQFFGVLALT